MPRRHPRFGRSMRRRRRAPVLRASAAPGSVAAHARSTAALCLAVLTVSYMLVSLFPYAAFMAIQLRPDVNLDGENAGAYAGVIAGAFMIGRTLSSYAWGQAADTYGRVTCLSASLILSSLFSLAFGLSTSFREAQLWRFLLGFANGILPISKTAVAELAGGDEELETRGMGLVLGMWGWGFLVAAASSGALAEPLKQYPDVHWLQNESRWYYRILEKFPFLLPNLVGTVFGLVALVAVNLFVTETLPKQSIRPLHHIPSYLWCSMKRLLSVNPEEDLISSESSAMTSRGEQNVYGAMSYDDYDDDSNEENLQKIEEPFNAADNDVSGAIREAPSTCDESVLLLSTTPHSRPSVTATVQRRSSASTARHRAGRFGAASSSVNSQSPEPATTASLWAQRSTRNHMLLFWVASLVMVATDEVFPLFCISKAAGLGLTEKSIGVILSTSGVILAVAQYLVYSVLLKLFSLMGSIRIGSMLMGPLVACVPMSLWWNQSNDGTGDENMDYVSIPALVFLR